MALAGDGTTSTWWAESRLSLAKAIGDAVSRCVAAFASKHAELEAKFDGAAR
jgi:hypothetical protein